MRLWRALAFLVVLASGCRNTHRPPELARLIQAADRAGLLTSAAFVDTTFSDSELALIRADLDSTSFLAIPTGAAPIIRSANHFVVGMDSATSFTVTAYSATGRLQLIHVFAPLVNAVSDGQGDLMMATIDSIATSLASDSLGLTEWIHVSAQSVWEQWETSRTRDDRIKERQFGDYLMAVSGVPPDFVFFGALRTQ